MIQICDCDCDDGDGGNCWSFKLVVLLNDNDADCQIVSMCTIGVKFNLIFNTKWNNLNGNENRLLSKSLNQVLKV